MTIKQYTDIGHDSPHDLIWIFLPDGLNKVRSGATFTHELLWGPEIVNCWRGRYEVATGFCSIVPPENCVTGTRPPLFLVDMLNANFAPVRFYYFKNGIVSFSPNPKRRK
jgi:hypothetical protein